MELTDKAKLELEKIIHSFSESYMSNSKWKRVFTELIQQKHIIKKCEIFDFFYSGINEMNWEKINDKSSEDITQEYISNNITTSEYPKTYYKEIEYIEFPKNWIEKTDSSSIRKTQNTEKIKEILSKKGKFKWEENEHGLKLIGYKNNDY